MKKLLALLLISTFILGGCLAAEEATEEEATEEVVEEVAQPTEPNYEEAILGTWYFIMEAPGGSIEGPATFYDDGTVTSSYGDVTAYTDSGDINQRVDYNDSQGTWSVVGNTMTTSGGQAMEGTFSDETHMSGTITDMQGVVAPWTAVKE